MRYLMVSVLTAIVLIACGEKSDTISQCGGTCTDVKTAAELTAALAGDTDCVCLLEGSYQGQFVLNTPKTVQGLGAEKSILTSAAGTPLTVNTGKATISNIGFKLDLAGLAETPALRMEPKTGGKTLADIALSNIAVSTTNGGGIRATDIVPLTLANATVTADAKGIVLLGKTQATLSGITASDCGRMGIAFANGAKGSVVNSTVLRNGYTGVWIQDTAEVLIADSTIKDNALAGINIVNAKNILIENSEIASSKPLEGKAEADGIVVYTPELSGDPIMAGDPIMQRAFTLLNSTVKDHPRAALIFDGTAASSGMELKNMMLDGVTIFRMDYGVVFQNGLAPESFSDNAGAVSEDYSDGYSESTSDVDTVNGGPDDPVSIGDEDSMETPDASSTDKEMPDTDQAGTGGGDPLPIENSGEEF